MTDSQRPRFLITGFEPFGGFERNPAGELACELADDPPPIIEVESVVLPVVFRAAGAQLRSSILRNAPDFVLSMGLAGRATGFRLERVALNFFRGGPDNKGGTSDGETITPSAPAAYFATLPVSALLARLAAAGVPARDSFSAGTYCCNEAFFVAAHTCAMHGLPTRVGFVHLPLFPEQVGERDLPSMARDVQRRGLRVLLDAIADLCPLRA